jgi:hypothetical protein
MSITHHFTREQARQFCETFGIDWHWSRSIDERPLAALEREKRNRSSTPTKTRGFEPPSSAASRSVFCFKRKHRSGKSS